VSVQSAEEMIALWKVRNAHRETCDIGTVSITNPTWNGLRKNPGPHSERPASTHLRRGMCSTDKTRISWYLSSLTLHTAVVSIVRPIGRRHDIDTFAKNVYSAGRALS